MTQLKSEISTILKSKNTLTTNLFTFFLIFSMMCGFMNFYTSLIPKVSANSQPPTITKINGENYIAGTTPVFNTNNISIEGDGSPNGLVGVYFSNGNKVCNYDINGVININEDGKWRCQTYLSEGDYSGLYTKQKDSLTDLFSSNSSPFNLQVQSTVNPAPVINQINGVNYSSGIYLPLNIGSVNTISGTFSGQSTGYRVDFGGIDCTNFSVSSSLPKYLSVDSAGNFECDFVANTPAVYTSSFRAYDIYNNYGDYLTINFGVGTIPPVVLNSAPIITKINGQNFDPNTSSNFDVNHDFPTDGTILIEGTSNNNVIVELSGNNISYAKGGLVKTGNYWSQVIGYSAADFSDPNFLKNLSEKEVNFSNQAVSQLTSTFNINLVATNSAPIPSLSFAITKINGINYTAPNPANLGTSNLDPNLITVNSGSFEIEGTGLINSLLDLQTSDYRNFSPSFVRTVCVMGNPNYNICNEYGVRPIATRFQNCNYKDKTNINGGWICIISLLDGDKIIDLPDYQTTFDFKIGNRLSVGESGFYNPFNYLPGVTIKVDVKPSTTIPSNILSINKIANTPNIAGSTNVLTDSKVLFTGTSNTPNSFVELVDGSNQIIDCLTYSEQTEVYFGLYPDNSDTHQLKLKTLKKTPTDNNGKWSCLAKFTQDNGIYNNIRIRNITNPSTYSLPINLQISNVPKILTINNTPFVEGTNPVILADSNGGRVSMTGTYSIPNSVIYADRPMYVNNQGNWNYTFLPQQKEGLATDDYSIKIKQESYDFFIQKFRQTNSTKFNIDYRFSNPTPLATGYPAPIVNEVNNLPYVSGTGLDGNPTPNSTPFTSVSNQVVLAGTGTPLTEMSIAEGTGNTIEQKKCFKYQTDSTGRIQPNFPMLEVSCRNVNGYGSGNNCLAPGMSNQGYYDCLDRSNLIHGVCETFENAFAPTTDNFCYAPKALPQSNTISNQKSPTFFSVDANGKWKATIYLPDGVHDLKLYTKKFPSLVEPQVSQFQINVAPIPPTPLPEPVITSINENIITPTTTNPTFSDTSNSTYTINGDDLSILFSGTGVPFTKIKLFNNENVSICKNFTSYSYNGAFVQVDALGNWKCYALVSQTNSDTLTGIYAKQYKTSDPFASDADTALVSPKSNTVNYRKIKLLTNPNNQTYDTFANFTFPNLNLVSDTNPYISPTLSAECSLNDSPFIACTTITNQSYSGLLAGNHKFVLRLFSSIAEYPPATASWTWRQLFAGSDCNPPALSSQNSNYILNIKSEDTYEGGFDIKSIFESIKASASPSSQVNIPHPGIAGVDYNNEVGENGQSIYKALINNPIYNQDIAPNNVYPMTYNVFTNVLDSKFGYPYSGNKVFPTSQPIGLIETTTPQSQDFSFDNIPNTSVNTFYNPGYGNVANPTIYPYRSSIEGFYTVVIRNPNQDTAKQGLSNVPVPSVKYALVFFTTYADFLNLPNGSTSNSSSTALSNADSCCSSTPPANPSSQSTNYVLNFKVRLRASFDISSIFVPIKVSATPSSSVNIPHPGIVGVDYNNEVSDNGESAYQTLINNPIYNQNSSPNNVYPMNIGPNSANLVNKDSKFGYPYTGAKVFPTSQPIGMLETRSPISQDFSFDNIPTTTVNTFYNPGYGDINSDIYPFRSSIEGFYTVVVRNANQDTAVKGGVPIAGIPSVKYALVFFTTYADFLNLPNGSTSNSSNPSSYNSASCCSSTPPANPSSQNTNYLLRYRTPGQQVKFNISRLFEPLKVSAISSSAVNIPQPGISGVDYNNLVGQTNFSSYDPLLNNPSYNGSQAPNNIQPLDENGDQVTKFGYPYTGTKAFPTSQPIGVLINTYPTLEDFSFDTIPTTTVNTFYNPGLSAYRNSIEGFYTIVIRNPGQDTGIFPDGQIPNLPSVKYALVFFTTYTEFLNLPNGSTSNSSVLVSSNSALCCNSTPAQSPTSSNISVSAFKYNSPKLILSSSSSVDSSSNELQSSLTNSLSDFNLESLFSPVKVSAYAQCNYRPASNDPAGFVSGIVGSTFPSITISNPPIATCPSASFQGAGSNSVVFGSIVGGNFVPNNDSIIPLDSIITPSSGIIKLISCVDLSGQPIGDVAIGTNFAPIPGGLVKGTIGNLFPIFAVNNNPILSCPATSFKGDAINPLYIPSGTTPVTVYGSITNGNFVPYPVGTLIPSGLFPDTLELPTLFTNPAGTILNIPQIIPLNSLESTGTAGIPNTGILNQENCVTGSTGVIIKNSGINGNINIKIDTDFNPVPKGSVSGLIETPFPIINVINNPVINCVTASFNGAGSSSTIIGSIVNGNFVPSLGQIIPIDSLSIPSVGTINQSNCGSNITVLTDFSRLPSSGNVAGVVGTPFPNIVITNNPIRSCPSLNSATFISDTTNPNGGVATVIQGSIVNGNFVPNPAGSLVPPSIVPTATQNIPLNSPIIPSSGIVTISGCGDGTGSPTGNISILISTNFTPRPTGEVSGVIGTPFPNITIINPPFQNCSFATFTGQNTINPSLSSTTPVYGSIIDGVFVPKLQDTPNSLQIIPFDSFVGPNGNGVISVPDCFSLPIDIITNFTVAVIPTTSTTGRVGQPFPAVININNPPVLSCSAATFAGTTVNQAVNPGGTPTVITGTIVNGNFVPNSNTGVIQNGNPTATIVPIDSILGAGGAGVIKYISCAGAPNIPNLPVTTNFLPPIIPTGTTSGNRGAVFPTILVINNPVQSCASATFQPFGSSAIIQGSIVNGNFVPSANQIIPFDATLGNSTGIITQVEVGAISGTGGNIGSTCTTTNGIATPNVNITTLYGQIIPTASITGTVGNPFPTILVTNNPVVACPSATFTGDGVNQSVNPGGNPTVITGSIIGGNFVPSLPVTPNAAQIIPLDSILGNLGTGIIKQINCGVDVSVTTNFTKPIASVTGIRGTTFPILIVINNPVTTCAAATFQPFGSSTIIQGSIVNSNFVPNPTSGVNGSAPVIPLDAQLGTSSGILKQASCGIDVNVVTQFGDPSLAISSVVATPSNGGVVIITNKSSSVSSEPVIVISKKIKPLTITINDPYLCNDDIYGKIDGEDNSQTIITVTLTKDSSNESTPITFKPISDQNGNYRIRIEHDNPNSPNYVPEDSYTINYSARISTTNQFTEGKPYKAYIINPTKCNSETTPLELPRTGGDVIAHFTLVVLILIGLVYLGEKRIS
jgi:hypothetical protein